MIDLKLSKSDKKKEAGIGPSAYKGPDYPWGFRIQFNESQIQKIDAFKDKDIEVGEMVVITAIGKVVEVRITDRDGEKKQENVEIQIQKIDVVLRNEAEAAFKEESKD